MTWSRGLGPGLLLVVQAALHFLVVAVVVEGQELVQDVDAGLRADREAGALRGLVEAVAEVDLPPGRQRRGRDPGLELADLRLAFLIEGVRFADRFVDLDVDLAEMDEVRSRLSVSSLDEIVELGKPHDRAFHHGSPEGVQFDFLSVP